VEIRDGELVIYRGNYAYYQEKKVEEKAEAEANRLIAEKEAKRKANNAKQKQRASRKKNAA
jgi:ATP-binding cassette subfamily F protein 3